MNMTRRFWREQQAALFVSVAGGLLFWWAHGFIKGALFALAIMLLMQPPIWWAYLKRR